MKAVFLDRDGVINEIQMKNGIPQAARPNNFVMKSGVKEGLKRLKDQNFALVVVSNQPDVARGTMELKEVEEINQLIQSHLPVDLIKICLHDNEDNCSCRKPKPGMLIEASQELGIDLKNSFLIGDRFKDIEAGKQAGVTTLLLGSGYREKEVLPTYQVYSIEEAVNKILSHVGGE